MLWDHKDVAQRKAQKIRKMVEKSMCLCRYRCHQGAWVAKQAGVLHHWSKGECRQEHTGDLRRAIPPGES